MKKLALLLLSTITLSVSAQDTLVSNSDSLKTRELYHVTITGVRPISKTPISQKTLTKDDITKTYQGQEMSYIITNTPSIITQSDGGQPNGYTTFRLRGIDQTRINMTLNGVPLNEPEDQGVYFSNYPNFALNIKSLQIQRGVGTSSNGTASYGGSINFESQNGLQKQTMAQIGYGSFNTQRANATYSSGLSKRKLALFTSLSGYKSDGYKYNSGGSGYSGFLSGGYYGDKNVIKFTGFSGRSLNQMAWLAVSESDIKLDPRTNYNAKGEDDDFTQSFGQLQYIRSISNKSSLTTTAYYNRLDGLWGMFVDPTTLMKFKLASNLYGVMSNYNYTTNKLSFNMGVHANTYDRTHGGVIGGSTLYTNTGTKVEYSGYTKLAYTYGKYTLYGDIQARHVGFSYVGDVSMTPLQWFFINPKGGVTYTKSNKVNYYVSIGKSHREPTRTDMFGGNDNLGTLNIITPEQVLDYELGSNVKLGKLSLQYNGYVMDFKNEITLLGALGGNGLPLMTNVSKSFRSGIEIDLNYHLTKEISLTNSSNYSYCRIKNGSETYQPLYTPSLIVNQGITYSKKGFIIGIQGKYATKSYITSDNSMTIPQYLTINANLGYTYKNYNVSIQGINLTNKNYYTSGYGIGGDRYLYVNAPSSFYITIKATL
jgi:iron complex outermembrane receptor protein